MSAEDLEKYETEMELQLYREYRDVVGLFSHVVETERRFYRPRATCSSPTRRSRASPDRQASATRAEMQRRNAVRRCADAGRRRRIPPGAAI